jgi:hypothetical protein
MRQLSDIRSIHAAVWENVNGRNDGVYASLPDGSVHRIIRARTVQGQLQVHSLETGRWVVPVMVFVA